ncbi:hypothetical protein ACMHYR_10290 [Serratia marcescens]
MPELKADPAQMPAFFIMIATNDPVMTALFPSEIITKINDIGEFWLKMT